MYSIHLECAVSLSEDSSGSRLGMLMEFGFIHIFAGTSYFSRTILMYHVSGVSAEQTIDLHLSDHMVLLQDLRASLGSVLTLLLYQGIACAT